MVFAETCSKFFDFKAVKA